MNERIDDVEDVEKAVIAGRIVRKHGPWLVAIGDENLAFSRHTVDDPILTGAQVLDIGGIDDQVEYAVFRMFESGLLEGIQSGEQTDIRSARVARFLIFRTDRIFRIRVADRDTEWGARYISGRTLCTLNGHADSDMDVWLDVRGGTDRQVHPDELVDLMQEGVERFFFRPARFHLVINGGPKTVEHRKESYWDIVKLAFPDAVAAENTIYTIDYGKGPAENLQGTLAEGQYVFVKDGMTFYVTPTDKS